MHLYDALIIGSGYSSLGYALARKNCIILEETQCCDAHFYLPLKSFIYDKYTPVTVFGKELNSMFEKYNLFNDGFMCTNAFEPTFCQFIAKENVNIILKSRVVTCKKLDDKFEVTFISAEGLVTVYAKNVYDTRPAKTAKRYITVISMTENIDSAVKILSKTFTDATFTKAFYDDRFAMHLPVNSTADINETLSYIHDKWLLASVDAKILYVAPVFATKKDDEPFGFPKDYNFKNPIHAFESGVLFAGGEK